MIIMYRIFNKCPWMGTCIGYENYPIFFSFLVLFSLNSVFVFTASVYYLSLFSITKSPIVLVLAIICGLLIWTSIGMTGYHLYLSYFFCNLRSRNVTTHEDIKFKYKDSSENPFHQGSRIKNLKYVLCHITSI
jgi:hypothetical protein